MCPVDKQMSMETESFITWHRVELHWQSFTLCSNVYDTNYYHKISPLDLTYFVLVSEDPSYDLLTWNLFQALKF